MVSPGEYVIWALRHWLSSFFFRCEIRFIAYPCEQYVPFGSCVNRLNNPGAFHSVRDDTEREPPNVSDWWCCKSKKKSWARLYVHLLPAVYHSNFRLFTKCGLFHEFSFIISFSCDFICILFVFRCFFSAFFGFTKSRKCSKYICWGEVL